MLVKLLLLTALAVVKSLAEAPLFNNQAPYAAAGFRPSIPFELPGEYYPSFDVDTEQLPNQGFTFEITKQRVDFAGQEVQRVPVSEPLNQYLPPEQIVFINNRVGNSNRGTKNFGHRHNHRQHFNGSGNGNGHGNGNGQTPLETPQNRPPQFQPNLPPLNIPLPKPNTDERFESQQRPAQQYGAPNYYVDPRNNAQQSQQAGSQYDDAYNSDNSNLGFVQPALEYGAPNNNIFEEQQQQQKPALEYGATDSSAYNKDDELAKQFALDALSAAIENYNRLQEKDIDKIAQGQYFVVNPDHSIQKVKFTTKKSDDESKQTDFTAELKYTKVGEIRDPLYKYTGEGQLVRIVKK